MANTVVSYHADPYGEYKLGFCKVNAGDKVTLILSVFRSKAGNICCGFNNIKIDGSWDPSFGFVDKDYERKFLNECREQVIKLMPPIPEENQGIVQQAPQPQYEQQPQSIPVNQKLPF